MWPKPLNFSLFHNLKFLYFQLDPKCHLKPCAFCLFINNSCINLNQKHNNQEIRTLDLQNNICNRMFEFFFYGFIICCNSIQWYLKHKLFFDGFFTVYFHLYFHFYSHKCCFYNFPMKQTNVKVYCTCHTSHGII